MEWRVIDVAGSDGKMRQLLTPLPEAIVFESGLPQEAIVGEVRPSRWTWFRSKSDRVDPDRFVHNPLFLRFLHQVLAKHVPTNPGLREAARRQGDGCCYVVDGRSPGFARGDVAPEDIVAEIPVQGGRVQEYRASTSYRPVSKHGLMRLEPYFESRLAEELTKLISGTGDSAGRASGDK